MEDNKMNISRRGFLKTAAVVGAALAIQPTINKVKAADTVLNGEKSPKKGQYAIPHARHGKSRHGSIGTRFRNNGHDSPQKPASRQETMYPLAA